MEQVREGKRGKEERREKKLEKESKTRRQQIKLRKVNAKVQYQF